MEKGRRHQNYPDKCNRKLWHSVNFVGVLNVCASIVVLEEGMYIHEQIIQSERRHHNRTAQAVGMVVAIQGGSQLDPVYGEHGSLISFNQPTDGTGFSQLLEKLYQP